MKKVRFGMTGTGRITDWVLKGAVLEPRFEAAAVCSRSREKGEAFAESHDIPKVYTDLDEMASDPEIDVIYIGTPNNTHKESAIRCMNHGKHVLCEKPLGSSAAEVREMIEAARRNNVILMEAMISTLSPNFRKVQETLKGLGEIRHYFAAFCQYSSKFDLVKRIVAGEENAAVPSSFNPDCSGGALLDIGIYPIYPMVTLFGKPKSIHAEVTTMDVPVGGTWKKIDVQGNVQFGYEGMSASVMYSKTTDSILNTEISGDGGIVSLDQIHITRHVDFKKRGTPTSGRSLGLSINDITVPVDDDEYLCEFREFIDVLQSGRKESVNNSLENSLMVAEIMDEIRRQAGVVFPTDLPEGQSTR